MRTTLMSQHNSVAEEIRASGVLTDEEVDSEIIDARGANQINLMVFFDKGTGDCDALELNIYASEDKEDWVNIGVKREIQQLYDVYTIQPIRLEESVNLAIPIPVSYSYIKFGAKAITSEDEPDFDDTDLVLVSVKANI